MIIFDLQRTFIVLVRGASVSAGLVGPWDFYHFFDWGFLCIKYFSKLEALMWELMILGRVFF
jgi:hypothetical protein